jgi:hypothetical protein
VISFFLSFCEAEEAKDFKTFKTFYVNVDLE